MVRFFALGLLLLPIVEIALFIKVGQTIGLFPTLALTIATSLLGALVLRQQGLSVITQMRGNMASGRMPARTIADTMMRGLAGVLLILPGFFTDAVALLLLLPPVREWLYGGLAKRVTVVDGTSYSAPRRPADERIGRPDVIDLDDDDYRPK